MIYVKESSADYNLLTVEDILDGYVGNVDDDQINADIKMWSRFSRILGSGKWYTHMSVLVDGDSFYDPSFNNAELIENKKGYKLYELNDVKVISEYRNGINFLYFKNKDDADKYISTVDASNADYELENMITEADETDDNSFVYTVDIELGIDTEADSSDPSVFDLESDYSDETYEIKDDAVNTFRSKLERELENKSVSIKNLLNVNEIDFDITDWDTDHISMYLTTDVEIDINKATTTLYRIVSNIEATASGDIEVTEGSGVDYGYNAPDTGVPYYDTYDVEYSVSVGCTSLDINKYN